MSQKETLAWAFTGRDISVFSMVKNKDMQLVFNSEPFNFLVTCSDDQSLYSHLRCTILHLHPLQTCNSLGSNKTIFFAMS